MMQAANEEEDFSYKRTGETGSGACNTTVEESGEGYQLTYSIQGLWSSCHPTTYRMVLGLGSLTGKHHFGTVFLVVT